jgi:hypothetical protein
MSHGERVAACLIVQNEQERLGAALDSVAFCDEVIVVDGGSSDRTVEIARGKGARVIENPWPGFAAQRNIAIDASSSDWILEVDADERVSPSLRESIERLLATPPPGVDMAVCPLRHRFLGGSLGHSAKYPGYRARLFRRGAYRHDESRAVHEGLDLHERPLILEGDLEHELAASLSEALLDTWRYAQLESHHVASPSAALPYSAGIVLRPLAKFLYRMIVLGGWRDGWRGALKISLDVGSDALVWVLVLRRGRGTAADIPESRDVEHFGRRRVGPAKVVALAAGGGSTREAAAWLSRLQAQGIDVTLISPEKPLECDVPLAPMRRLMPLAAMRAIDAEMHLRIIDAVVPVGRRARLVWRLLPSTLRPEIAGVDQDVAPAQAAAAAQAVVS